MDKQLEGLITSSINLAKATKAYYDELLNQGLNEDVAKELTKHYMVILVTPKDKNKTYKIGGLS